MLCSRRAWDVGHGAGGRLRARRARRGRRPVTAGVVVLVGEAGVGKSRLAHERRASEPTQLGMAGLAGRCVPGDSPSPTARSPRRSPSALPRPVAPARPAAGRVRRPPRQARAAAGADDGAGGTDESPVLLGEAVVRLAQPRRADDGHPAPPRGPALGRRRDARGRRLPRRHPPRRSRCSASARRGPRAGWSTTLARLRRNDARRRSSTSTPLPPDDVREHRRGLPGHATHVPADVAHVDASATATASRSSSRSSSPGWSPPARSSSTTSGGPPRARCPHRSPRRRAVDPPAARRRSTRRARRIIRAAAMLGRRFDWELLPGVAEVDGRAAVDALRAAVDAQIIEVEGDEFLFRHAVTREAVLERPAPAGAPRPGLPRLARRRASQPRAARRGVRAGRRPRRGGRRAREGGRAARRERPTRRWPAARTPPPRPPPSGPGASLPPTTPVALDADAHRWCRSSRPPASRPPRSPSAGPLVDAAARARAAAGVDRPAARAGPGGAGRRRRRRGRAGSPTPPGRTSATTRRSAARVDAIAAYVALDQGRLADAGELGPASRRRRDRAPTQPAVACEALEVLGRVADVTDAGTSDRWFQQAADLAAAHGLAGWELRPATSWRSQAWGRRRHAAARARSATWPLARGALVTQAVMDLSLADLALAGFEREGCLAAATVVRRRPAAATGSPPSRSPTSGWRARMPWPATTRPWRRRWPTRWPATPTTRGSWATSTAVCS